MSTPSAAWSTTAASSDQCFSFSQRSSARANALGGGLQEVHLLLAPLPGLVTVQKAEGSREATADHDRDEQARADAQRHEGLPVRPAERVHLAGDRSPPGHQPRQDREARTPGPPPGPPSRRCAGLVGPQRPQAGELLALGPDLDARTSSTGWPGPRARGSPAPVGATVAGSALASSSEATLADASSSASSALALGLGLLLHRHVDHHPAEPRDAHRARHHRHQVAHPHVPPVGGQEAVVQLVVLALQNRRPAGRQDALAVLRVQPRRRRTPGRSPRRRGGSPGCARRARRRR